MNYMNHIIAIPRGKFVVPCVKKNKQVSKF